jgi:hypothetical protein
LQNYQEGMPRFSLQDWMDTTRPEAGVEELLVLRERPGKRTAVEAAIGETVKDHLAGLDVVSRISGYEKSRTFGSTLNLLRTRSK